MGRINTKMDTIRKKTPLCDAQHCVVLYSSFKWGFVQKKYMQNNKARVKHYNLRLQVIQHRVCVHAGMCATMWE